MEEIPKSKYTEAQKRATKKYRENNKEKVNEQRKKYYLNRKTKDPKFLEYKRLKAKEYYQKKKAIKSKVDEKIDELKLKSKDVEEIKKVIEDVKQEIIVPKVEEHPIIDETIQEKKKRKYVKKNKIV